MRSIVALLSLLSVPVLAFGCTTTTGTGTLTSCTPVTPDGGSGATNAVCDVAWVCNDDTQHFELACAFSNGTFSCTCFTEGAPTKTFVVNVFSCDAESALPAASSGCEWTINP